MPPSLAELEAALAGLEVELRLVRVDGHWEAPTEKMSPQGFAG